MKFTLALSAILATQTASFSPSFASPRGTALDARKPFISGNWKLNPQTREEAIVLGKAISESIGPDSPDCDVALFVPYVFIEATHTAVGEKLMVGAEVCICLLLMLGRYTTCLHSMYSTLEVHGYVRNMLLCLHGFMTLTFYCFTFYF